MARMRIVQQKNATYSRLLELQIDALNRSLRHSLSQSERRTREILRCFCPGNVYCKECITTITGNTCFNKMEHKRFGLRLHHSVDDEGMTDKRWHKSKPERSHSDNSMKLGYQEVMSATHRGHATLADLKQPHSSKRSLHGSPHTSHTTTAASSLELKHGLTGLHHHQGDLSNRLLKQSEMLNHSLTKSVDLVDNANSSDTNLTAFLFSRHCRHGYVMKRSSDPTEQTNDKLKSKIRAKVVKNYLLQDVFKRLNTTNALAVTKGGSESYTDKHAGLTPETMQTLKQCRYLRLPPKRTTQGTCDTDEEDERLPKVDV